MTRSLLRAPASRCATGSRSMGRCAVQGDRRLAVDPRPAGGSSHRWAVRREPGRPGPDRSALGHGARCHEARRGDRAHHRAEGWLSSSPPPCPSARPSTSAVWSWRTRKHLRRRHRGRSPAMGQSWSGPGEHHDTATRTAVAPCASWREYPTSRRHSTTWSAGRRRGAPARVLEPRGPGHDQDRGADHGSSSHGRWIGPGAALHRRRESDDVVAAEAPRRRRASRDEVGSADSPRSGRPWRLRPQPDRRRRRRPHSAQSCRRRPVEGTARQLCARSALAPVAAGGGRPAGGRASAEVVKRHRRGPGGRSQGSGGRHATAGVRSCPPDAEAGPAAAWSRQVCRDRRRDRRGAGGGRARPVAPGGRRRRVGSSR